MLVRILSKPDSGALLAPFGLTIGNWNEIVGTELASGEVVSVRAPHDGLELFVLVGHLAHWIGCDEWAFFQVDNSTSPTNDEIAVFQAIALRGAQWDIVNERSFVFSALQGNSQQGVRTTIGLVMYFSLLFEWHVHVTANGARSQQRLALQDGVVHFFGDTLALERARSLLKLLAENPLRTCV